MIQSDKKIILGIDPGIERLGIAILEKDPLKNPKENLTYSECFKTHKSLPLEKRLSLIYKKVEEIIKKYNPDIVAIEKIFFSVNQKTAIVVAESRGAVLAAVGSHNKEIIEMAPTEIKESVTGNGNAKKEDIARMIPLILPNIPLKNQDDELDAIAIALAASSRLRYSHLYT